MFPVNTFTLDGNVFCFCFCGQVSTNDNNVRHLPVCLVHMPANSSSFTDHSLQLLSTSTHLDFMLSISLSCSSCRVILSELALPTSSVLLILSVISLQALQSLSILSASSKLLGDPYPVLHLPSAPSIQPENALKSKIFACKMKNICLSYR